MNNVCKVNQNITDKFKHLDDVQYQQEYDEHCRKMSIIDSYEEEIKEVLFLSSGCVDTSSHSYKEYGLGLRPDYINFEDIVDKIQALKSSKLGLKYLTYRCYSLWGFVGSTEEQEKYEIIFVCNQGYKEYRGYLIEKINKYSKEFYNKEYFLRSEGSFMDSYYTLVTKDETWNMEYLRNGDTLHSWEWYVLAMLLPIFGWYFVLYSMYEAVRLYIKHKGD